MSVATKLNPVWVARYHDTYPPTERHSHWIFITMKSGGIHNKEHMRSKDYR